MENDSVAPCMTVTEVMVVVPLVAWLSVTEPIGLMVPPLPVVAVRVYVGGKVLLTSLE